MYLFLKKHLTHETEEKSHIGVKSCEITVKHKINDMK